MEIDFSYKYLRNQLKIVIFYQAVIKIRSAIKVKMSASAVFFWAFWPFFWVTCLVLIANPYFDVFPLKTFMKVARNRSILS